MILYHVQRRGVDKSILGGNYKRVVEFLTPYFEIICLKK
jgi:hypothetical protein